MRRFRLSRPESLDAALATLAAEGLHGRPLGGGTDLVAGLMRDQVIGTAMPYPRELVDITRLAELRGIRADTRGLTIGSATTLVDLAESPEVMAAWPLIAQAASQVASPEIRAIATLGGNLNQRPRCWFFRNRDFDCVKKGGRICYAVNGDSRYNAILDGSICYIVHPSDLGTAFVALGATARIASPSGQRRVTFDDYFVGPAENLVAETVLKPDEILMDVFIPAPKPGARQVWHKVNEKGRQTWDFALASVAAVARLQDGIWQGGRVVIGAVAPVPYRAHVVETALQGRSLVAAVPDAVAALREAARPMRDNAWKVEIAAAALEDALMQLARGPGQ